jgi:hypothetical protein
MGQKPKSIPARKRPVLRRYLVKEKSLCIEFPEL